jgi:hypothetical protein
VVVDDCCAATAASSLSAVAAMLCVTAGLWAAAAALFCVTACVGPTLFVDVTEWMDVVRRFDVCRTHGSSCPEETAGAACDAVRCADGDD